jgi:hypothetical protein
MTIAWPLSIMRAWGRCRDTPTACSGQSRSMSVRLVRDQRVASWPAVSSVPRAAPPAKVVHRSARSRRFAGGVRARLMRLMAQRGLVARTDLCLLSKIADSAYSTKHRYSNARLIVGWWRFLTSIMTSAVRIAHTTTNAPNTFQVSSFSRKALGRRLTAKRSRRGAKARCAIFGSLRAWIRTRSHVFGIVIIVNDGLPTLCKGPGC